MDEKDWQFYIETMKRIILRMLPNFGGDIVTGLRLIEEEHTQWKARIKELEEDIADKIREFCPACVFGVADTKIIEGIVNNERGEPELVYVGEDAIECQYCGELIKAILESADKSNQSDKEK